MPWNSNTDKHFRSLSLDCPSRQGRFVAEKLKQNRLEQGNNSPQKTHLPRLMPSELQNVMCLQGSHRAKRDHAFTRLKSHNSTPAAIFRAAKAFTAKIWCPWHVSQPNHTPQKSYQKHVHLSLQAWSGFPTLQNGYYVSSTCMPLSVRGTNGEGLDVVWRWPILWKTKSVCLPTLLA